MTKTVAQQLKVGAEWPGLPGSRYAGISVGTDGQPDGHLVLLADKPAGTLNWTAAVAWAEGVGDGARLPTRDESALLYANLRGEFETGWHWTGTQSSSDLAWYQYFLNGSQITSIKKFEARARAVRRFSSSVLQSFDATPSGAKAESVTNALLRQLVDETKGLRTDFSTAFLVDIGVKP